MPKALAATDRVTITIRIPRDELERIQSLYYATVSEHRRSFNAWIVALLATVE